MFLRPQRAARAVSIVDRHQSTKTCLQANHKPTWQISILIGTLGSLCLLFFILICFVCLEPFRCNEHPNGLATMQTAHSVFCNFTDQHLSLCIMALVMLIAPVGFLAVSSWILAKELPRRVAQGDTNFIRMTSFLTMRFKPGESESPSHVFVILILWNNYVYYICIYIYTTVLHIECSQKIDPTKDINH